LDLGIQALNDAIWNEEADNTVTDGNDDNADNADKFATQSVSRPSSKKTPVLDSDEEKIRDLVESNDEKEGDDNDGSCDDQDNLCELSRIEENDNDNNFFEDNNVCFLFVHTCRITDSLVLDEYR
jgi:hypothetical protein